MYHVIETILTVSLLYLVSYIFSRIGLYSPAEHKKLWNVVLAITFLFTALAGIFMALQITFTWTIPVIKAILKWHVEIGIGLGVTGIFHFIWHLPYFGKIFTRTENHSETPDIQKINSSSVYSNLFIIGFVSTSVQVLLIREILNISGGYELTTGVFLASWLITSATGAAIAGKSNLNNIPRINMIFSLSPLISLLLLFLLSRLLLETGETPSFLVSMIFTILVLFPFCLVSGFSFVKLIASARVRNGYVPGKSFSVETTGGIIAGILITVLTSGLVNTYKLLLIIILISIAYTSLTFFITNEKAKTFVRLLFVILFSVVILTDPDVVFRQLLIPGINITETKDTPYGNITKGEYSGEQSIYYNQRLLAYNDDVTEREEDIHYALLQRPNPEKVLLISGFLESHLQEILKYPVKKIFFIERDPALVKSALSQTYNGSAQLIIYNKDAFRYIRRNGESFDAAILLLPPPSTLSLNRFYTTDFFHEIKNRLTTSGVFMCSPVTGENYLNQESINLCSAIYNSLSGVFKHVLPVAGNKLYFIASDDELSTSFCQLAAERGIKNIYVSSDFLSDDLIKRKSDEIISVIDLNTRQNRSVFPVACFHFQSYNFSKNLNEKTPAIVLMILAFAVPVLTVKRKNLIMYFSASALAGFEIIILLTLQLTAGNMYQSAGLILASLMAGLAIGAGTDLKLLRYVSLNTKALFLIFYYVIIALCFTSLLTFKGILAPIVLVIISIVLPSYLTGHIFRELTLSADTGSATGATYSADLAGSALGFILISGVAVPAFGIKASIILLALLIFAGVIFGTTRNK